MCVSMYVILRNIRQYTNIWSTERGIFDVGCNFNTMVKLDPPYPHSYTTWDLKAGGKRTLERPGHKWECTNYAGF